MKILVLYIDKIKSWRLIIILYHNLPNSYKNQINNIYTNLINPNNSKPK